VMPPSATLVLPPDSITVTPRVSLSVMVWVAVAGAPSFEVAVQRAIDSGREPALDGALAGALAGAFQGAGAIPAAAVAGLSRLDLLEGFAARLCARAQGGAPGELGAEPGP